MRESRTFFKLSLALLIVLVLFGTSMVLVLASGNSSYEHLQLLMEIRSYVEDKYVQKVDLERMDAGTLTGLVVYTDRYNCIYDYNQPLYPVGLDGRLGFIFGAKEGAITVVSTIEGSPARKAGLSSGDIVLSIGKTETYRLSVMEAQRLDYGSIDDLVKVSVRKQGDDAFKDLNLVFQRLTGLPPIEGEMLPSSIALVKVRSLSHPNIIQETAQMLKSLEDKASGLILDLRYTADGSIDKGVALADILIADGIELGYLKGKEDANLRSYLSRDHLCCFKEKPVKVLINNSTAMGAEVAAAILQEIGNFETVGIHTFGMAYESKTFDIDHIKKLRLLVATFNTPSGTDIHLNGVKADQGVEAGTIIAVDSEPKPEQPASKIIEILTGKAKAADKQLKKAEELILNDLEAR